MEMNVPQSLPQVRLSSARRNGCETVNRNNNNRLVINTCPQRDHITRLKNLTVDALSARHNMIINKKDIIVVLLIVIIIITDNRIIIEPGVSSSWPFKT